ncbi:MAG: hypothetical protein GEV03_20935 [Streptosporangiales bacterium]|nr:hypothetical protein [Streptosporangiales bacterium]
MPAVMRAAAAIERANIPAVAIGATGFEPLGRAIGRSLGISHVPIVIYPGVISTDDTGTFRRKLSETVVPQVVAALTGGPPGEAAEQPKSAAQIPRQAEPEPQDVVYSGVLDDIQSYFTAQGWTDGLPVIPPTIDRAERFFEFTDRSPDEVIGVLPPDYREATAWNVAVNGVMAGCLPEYFPILLAIVECLADPDFRIEDAGSTFGWEPMVVLSGPLVSELEFNTGTGVMRVGRQANTSIGRFVRLYMRNVAGLRIPPGHTDQAAIGYTFNVVLPEDDRVVDELGWSPYRVDRGFPGGETIVSIQQVVNISAPIYTSGDRIEHHLETIGRLFGNAIGPWAYSGIVHGGWYPLLVLSPSVARTLARCGVGKDELRDYLYTNVRAPAYQLERYHQHVRNTPLDLATLVRRGEADPVYARSDDPERLVPMFVHPEWIGIVVAGNPNRAQSRAYVGNHKHAPVSRVVHRGSRRR